MAYYIKQNLQTAKLNSKGTLSEVNLFHTMMETFRFCYGATVIVSETHQNYVGFDAVHPVTGVPEADVTREISDIHIITYSPSRVMARETFLQAKVTPHIYNQQSKGAFVFDGDWRQYDLLSRRPLLKHPQKKPPYLLCYYPQYLRQAVLPSIGSYGVFYKDQNGCVDFAYQPANRLLLSGMSGVKAKLQIDCTWNKYNIPIVPDLQYSFSVDEFEDAVIRQMVGSPFILMQSTIDQPSWHLGRDLFWSNFISTLDDDNNPAELAYTLNGLLQFEDFVLRNQKQFIKDGQERIECLRRYHNIGQHNHNDEDARKPLLRGEDGERRRLCHGATSLVLINVDNIEK